MANTNIRSVDIHPQLFIGDVNPLVTENDLFQLLNSFGSIHYIRLIRSPNSKFNLGFALVSFKDPESSSKARRELNGYNLKGNHIRVVMYTRDRVPEANIFVKFFPERVSTKELEDRFSLFGNIISSKISYDEHGKSLRYGFIQFDTKEAAQKAIRDMNSAVWDSEQITVSAFLPVIKRIDATHMKNLYVRGFPNSFTDEDIKHKFEQFGEVASVVMLKAPGDRAFALVSFSSEDDAKRACELHNSQDPQDFS